MIENIKLDKNNIEFNNALELVERTNRTIFLTGKAGTGKTTFLKYLKLVSKKSMIVPAPTGVAAINNTPNNIEFIKNRLLLCLLVLNL